MDLTIDKDELTKQIEYWLSTNIRYDRFPKEIRYELMKYMRQYINEDISLEEYKRIEDEFEKMSLSTFKGKVKHFIYKKRISRIKRKIIRVYLFDSSLYYGEPINIRFKKIQQLVENMTNKELIKWKDKWDWDSFISDSLRVYGIVDYFVTRMFKFKKTVKERRSHNDIF